MSQISRNYARALYELHISPEALSRAEEITTQVPVLLDILKDPACALVQKYRAIERIFPEETQNFLKVLCFYQSTVRKACWTQCSRTPPARMKRLWRQ